MCRRVGIQGRDLVGRLSEVGTDFCSRVVIQKMRVFVFFLKGNMIQVCTYIANSWPICVMVPDLLFISRWSMYHDALRLTYNTIVYKVQYIWLVQYIYQPCPSPGPAVPPHRRGTIIPESPLRDLSSNWNIAVVCHLLKLNFGIGNWERGYR